MPAGRPTKYKPEYCQSIVEWMAEGKLVYDWAKEIGIHICSVYEWKEKHPAFSEALKKGEKYKKYVAEKFVHDAVYNPNINNVAFVMMCRNYYRLKTKDPDDGSSKENTTIIIKDKDQEIVDRLLSK